MDSEFEDRNLSCNESFQLSSHMEKTKPLSFRTSYCRQYLQGKKCKYSRHCRYAHDISTLRTVFDNMRDGIDSEDAVKKFLEPKPTYRAHKERQLQIQLQQQEEKLRQLQQQQVQNEKQVSLQSQLVRWLEQQLPNRHGVPANGPPPLPDCFCHDPYDMYATHIGKVFVSRVKSSTSVTEQLQVYPQQ